MGEKFMNTNFLHDIHNLDNNILNQTIIKVGRKAFLISTIDLKFDINNNPNIPPEYYETKIFSIGSEDIYYNDPMFLERYSTKDEAIKAHDLVIKSLENGSLKMQNGFFEFMD